MIPTPMDLSIAIDEEISSLDASYTNYVAGISNFINVYQRFLDRTDPSVAFSADQLAFVSHHIDSLIDGEHPVSEDSEVAGDSLAGLVNSSRNVLLDINNQRSDFLDRVQSLEADLAKTLDNATQFLENYAVDGMLGSGSRIRDSIERYVDRNPRRYIPGEPIEALLSAARQSLEDLPPTSHNEDGDVDPEEIQAQRCFASSGILFGVAEMIYLGSTYNETETITMPQDMSFLEHVIETLEPFSDSAHVEGS